MANWTRDQLQPALALYHQLRFGQLDSDTPSVIALASKIGRTPGAVAMKLNNFASLDPAVRARGVAGLTGASKLDREIWAEFEADRGGFVDRNQPLVEAAFRDAIPKTGMPQGADFSGTDTQRLGKVRQRQQFFRRAVLSSYDGMCCITGLSDARLLVASHIRPWNKDPKNRLNPSNGLCLSAIHDRAFDAGLITVTPDLKILVADVVRKQSKVPFAKQWLIDLHGRSITKPGKSLPSPEFLDDHNRTIFKGNLP